MKHELVKNSSLNLFFSLCAFVKNLRVTLWNSSKIMPQNTQRRHKKHIDNHENIGFNSFWHQIFNVLNLVFNI